MAKKFISQFPAEEIDARLAAVSEKVGGSFFDSTSNTIYFFKSIEDRDAWVDLGMPPTSDLVIFTQVLSFEGEVKKIDIEVDGGLLQYYTTTASSAPIKLHYYSKVKGITDAEWEYIPESADVTISVQKAGESTETVAFNGSLQSSLMEQTPTYLTVDLKQYLSVGTNTVKVVVRGKTSETESKTSISATLTTMSLYANDRFNWHMPCLQTGEYQLGGFFYTGNIQKTLNVRIANYDGNGAEAVFTKSLGYDVATDVPASFTLNDELFIANNYEFPTTGVHQVDIWLTAGTVRSDVLSHDMMFVRTEDVNSAQLVVVNDVAKKIVNGTETTMFYFALYDGVNVYTSEPTIIDVYNGSVEVVSLGSELNAVETQKKISYVKLVDVSSDDNEFTLTSKVTFVGCVATDSLKVDNSANFPAESGAIFYFNAANRTNQDAQREKVLDEATNKYIEGNTYVGFSWVDGMDGYTIDDEGNRCFRVPAGSKAIFNVAPFANVSTINGISFELVYKVTNAANEIDDVITIYDDTLNSESGLKIKPTNVLLHSSLLHDELQQYNTKDEELVHLIVSLIPNHTVNGRPLGYGIAQIYVNGTKKTLFEYDPNATQSWGGASKIAIGSLTAETFLYKIRTYPRGFVWKSSAMNYVNSRLTREERSELDREVKSIVNESYDIDYHKCVAEGKNVMVIEMLNGSPLPDLLHDPGDDGVKCNVLFNFPDVDVAEMDDDFKHILHGGADNWQTNRTMEGQGSTAMTYHRWNFRWKKLIGADGETERRITAKKNVASSMQDHKMGATRMYNDVFFYLLENGKLGDASVKCCPRVAIYQYPAFGFLKVLEGDEYAYKFIGLYTVGPDKGDKLLFDFKNKQYKQTLIHMEGADHTPISVGFEYPWKALDYLPSEEALGGVLSKLSDGTTSSIDKAWEVGAAGSYEPDAAADKEGIMTMLTNEFKPAYEVAYNNSPFIIGITEDELAEMTSDAIAWRAKVADADRDYKLQFASFEFYVEGVYDLYYYDACAGKYEKTGLNVKSDLKVTDKDVADRLSTDGTTQYLFREKRRERFKKDWGNYWHKEDAIYHYSILQLIAATDNYKKNTYPYKFAPLTEGGKWRWRQDDLDTIFDVDNTGLSKKNYDILVGDVNDTGVSVYKGDTSVFWLLIRETQAEEVEAMTINILDAMCALSGAEGVKLQQVLAYIDKTFWQKAQRYFGVAGYNEDSEWTYEESYAINPNTAVPALDQASGDHYEAEYNWVFRRILFYASLLRYGTFTNSAYNENVFGQIQFRATANKTLDIIPSISMTPAIFVGESKTLGAKKRVFAGETYPIMLEVPPSADTIMTLPAADYLADIGDFSGVGNANGEGLNLSAKRLRKLKMGGVIPEGQERIANNFSSLTINNAPSLEELNCKNCWNLQGTINLSSCKRIKSVDISGTKVSSITFPEGCKVNSLQLPSSYVNLTLRRFPNLTIDSIEFDDIKTLNTLVLESNSRLNGYSLLKKVVETDGHLLKNISIVGFETYVTGGDILLLAKLATAEENGFYKYQGLKGTIDEVGAVRQNPPIVNGTLNATEDTKAYETDVDIVNKYYDANIVDYTRYIPFEDPEVKRVVLASGIGDGYGVTESEASAVTTELQEAFKNNTVVRKFNELSLFNNASVNLQRTFEGCTALEEAALDTTKRYIDSYMFKGCTALKRVTWGDNKTEVRTEAFRDCISLEEIGDISNFTGFSAHVFRGCKNLKIDVYLTATKLGDGNHTFSNSGITSFSAPNLESWTLDIVSSCGYCENLESVYIPKLTKIGEAQFRNNPNLKSLTLSQDLTSIGVNAFRESFHQDSNIELDLPNLITLGQSAFNKSNIRKFSAQTLTNPASYCFSYCALLTHVNMPSLQSLPTEFFIGCSKLESVEIPRVLVINAHCFNGCESLKTLTVNSVRSISNSVFFKSGITNIEMGNIETIGERTFDGTPLEGDYEWSKLRTVGQYCFRNTKINSVKTDNLQDIGAYAFNNSKIRFLTQNTDVPVSIQTNAFTDSSIEEVRVKNLVSISSGFYRCTKLKYIDVANLESITAAGFYQTSLLAMDFIAPKLRSMSVDSTFSSSAITSFIAPYLEGRIGKWSLQYCNSLTEIVIGNVTSLGDYCFGACPILTRVVIYLEEVPDVITGVFTGSTCPIYLPDDLVETVKALTGWSDYASRIKSFSEGSIPTDKEELLTQYTQQ